MPDAVIVYSQEGCPPCGAVKEYLTRRGVPFVVKDIGRDVSARNEFLRKGFRGTPVVLVGDEAIVGFDRARIDRALLRQPRGEQAKTPVDIVW
ncbi:glutaredoxin family protein [bacterium]|nr:glutaredoxin family protein [bacterium]